MRVGAAIQFINERCRYEDRGYATPCFVWQYSLTKKGYAKTTVQGERWRIHRLAYILHVAPIPDGLTIDHLCLVKSCCNPAHLEAVTDEENRRRAGLVSSVPGACKRGHSVAEHRGPRGCRLCQRERNWKRSGTPEVREQKAALQRARAERKRAAAVPKIRRLETHCRNGHLRTPDNTAFDKNGYHRCRICWNLTASLAWRKGDETVRASMLETAA